MKQPLLISAAILGVLALTWQVWPSASSPSAKGKSHPASLTASFPSDATGTTSSSNRAPVTTPTAAPGAIPSGQPTSPPSVGPDAKTRSLLSPRRLSISDAVLAWQSANLPARTRLDPFADEAISVPPTRSGSIQPEPASLTIQGISINGTRAFAVINRNIVTEGDRVGNWCIETIQPDAVWVRSITTGRIALQLSRTSATPASAGATPASETAGAANRDLPLAAATSERLANLPVPVSAPLSRPDPGPH